MLRELLSAVGGGETTEGGGPPDRNKLACYIALVRELLSSGAFGPLSNVMAEAVANIYNGLYAGSNMTKEELFSNQAPASASMVDTTGTPMFEMLAEREHELQGARAEVTRLMQKIQAASAYGPDSPETRAQQAEIAALQAQLAAAAASLSAKDHELTTARAEKRRIEDRGRQESQTMGVELHRLRKALDTSEKEVIKYKAGNSLEDAAKVWPFGGTTRGGSDGEEGEEESHRWTRDPKQQQHNTGGGGAPPK